VLIGFFSPPIKRHLDNTRRHLASTYDNKKLLAHNGMLDWKISHPYVLFEIRRRASRCDRPHFYAVNYDRIAVTRRDAIQDFKPNELAPQTFSLLLFERRAPDEITFR
jgi:hypothetical protein